jgi:hypothetical protein
MALLRIFLAWLLLAAMPLQGFAAASMLFCGPAGAAQHQLAKAPGAEHDHGHHTGAVASAHGHAAAEAPSVSSALPDATHTCGLCASCCHSVAIAATPFLLSSQPAPQLAWEQAFVPLLSRPSPVPDKPPRA